VSEKETEFARIVATHRRALLRYALRRLDDHTDAEDLVAEALVVAWRRLSELPSREEELYWLYGIAGRVLANMMRGRQRSMRLEMRLAFEREKESDPQRYSEDDVKQLMSALSHLKAEERELLQLTYWERLSYREIGSVLGCTERTAGVRISRARQHLRELLNESAPAATITHLPNQETL
jgi:RNA polymerase sigma-70 factor (ECF subfamily)